MMSEFREQLDITRTGGLSGAVELTCGIRFLTDFWRENIFRSISKTAAARLSSSQADREAARLTFCA